MVEGQRWDGAQTLHHDQTIDPEKYAFQRVSRGGEREEEAKWLSFCFIFSLNCFCRQGVFFMFILCFHIWLCLTHVCPVCVRVGGGWVGVVAIVKSNAVQLDYKDGKTIGIVVGKQGKTSSDLHYLAASRLLVVVVVVETGLSLPAGLRKCLFLQ